MAATTGEGGSPTRAEQKERTRRAILDAALELSEESGLAGLSLRQVARRAGVVPTAFYRHFDSIEDLGRALVDESFASLRAMLRDVRRDDPAPAQLIERSVAVLAGHVREHRPQFGLLARERASGPRAVREAYRHELDLVERELATDLARLGVQHWSADDCLVLADLIVGAMVTTVEALLAAPSRDAEQALQARAERQLRMVVVGARHWHSDHQA